jgi:predicted RND superfamily exporter protein
MLNYKKYIAVVIVVVLVIALFFNLNKTRHLENENKVLKDSALFYNAQAKTYIKMYENLKEKDGVLVKTKDSLIRQKSKIKKVYVQKIKLVSKYSVSDMQCYFDERTGKGCNTGQHSVSKDNNGTNKW